MRLDEFARRNGLTRFGAWMIRRGPFVVGAVYGFLLIPVALFGAVSGLLGAVAEWKQDRRSALGTWRAYRDEVDR